MPARMAYTPGLASDAAPLVEAQDEPSGAHAHARHLPREGARPDSEASTAMSRSPLVNSAFGLQVFFVSAIFRAAANCVYSMGRSGRTGSAAELLSPPPRSRAGSSAPMSRPGSGMLRASEMHESQESHRTLEEVSI